MTFSSCWLVLSATADFTSRRLRERTFEVRMCRAPEWWRTTLPVPVFLNLLDAPLWVFSFGIMLFPGCSCKRRNEGLANLISVPQGPPPGTVHETAGQQNGTRG